MVSTGAYLVASFFISSRTKRSHSHRTKKNTKLSTREEFTSLWLRSCPESIITFSKHVIQFILNRAVFRKQQHCLKLSNVIDLTDLARWVNMCCQWSLANGS